MKGQMDYLFIRYLNYDFKVDLLLVVFRSLTEDGAGSLEEKI